MTLSKQGYVYDDGDHYHHQDPALFARVRNVWSIYRREENLTPSQFAFYIAIHTFSPGDAFDVDVRAGVRHAVEQQLAIDHNGVDRAQQFRRLVDVVAGPVWMWDDRRGAALEWLTVEALCELFGRSERRLIQIARGEMYGRRPTKREHAIRATSRWTYIISQELARRGVRT